MVVPAGFVGEIQVIDDHSQDPPEADIYRRGISQANQGGPVNVMLDRDGSRKVLGIEYADGTKIQSITGATKERARQEMVYYKLVADETGRVEVIKIGSIQQLGK